MGRINYTFESGGHHNNIVIDPIVSDMTLFSIYIVDNNNNRVNLVASPTFLNGKKIFRYDYTISNLIEVVIGHPSASSLELGKDIKIHASLQKFTNNGYFVTPNQRAIAGNKLYLYSKISNESSYAIMANLSINVLNNTGDVIESAVARIPLNDDRIIGHKGDQNLIYSPYDLKLFSEDSEINKDSYTVDDFKINSSKDLGDTVVIYKPIVGKLELSSTIYMDDSFNIYIDNPLKAYVEYSIKVDLFNTKIKNLNSTPIINQLALVVTD